MPVITEPDPSLRRPGSAGRVYEIMIEENRRNNNNRSGAADHGGGVAHAEGGGGGGRDDGDRAVVDELDFDFDASQHHQRQQQSVSRFSGARPAEADASSSLAPVSRTVSSRHNRDLRGAPLASTRSLGSALASNDPVRPTGSGSILDPRGIPGGHSGAVTTWAHFRCRTKAKIEELEQKNVQLQTENDTLRQEAAVRNDELDVAKKAHRLAEDRSVQLQRDCELTIQRQWTLFQSLLERRSWSDPEEFQNELDRVRRVVGDQLQALDDSTTESRKRPHETIH